MTILPLACPLAWWLLVRDTAITAEVQGLIPGLVRSDTVLPMACHSFDTSSHQCCPGAKSRDGPRGCLYALLKCRKYNEDLIFLRICFGYQPTVL